MTFQKLSREFLLVDLVNNLDQVSEDVDNVKQSIKHKLNTFNKNKLRKMAECYGKAATKKYFKGLLQ